MNWIKKENSSDISEIVQKRTGMSEKQLLDDKQIYHYNNLKKAADLYVQHVKKGSSIACFCDYDTDGVTSASIQRLIAKALRLRNWKDVEPRRFSDGYGIKERHIDFFKDYNLLILCDNGIAAAEAVQKAIDLGIDVIILDHHQPRVDEKGSIVMPPATVVVDPHITGGDFEDLCGAGLSYRFAEAVFERCPWMSDKQKWFFLSRASAFAALGTIGDVVSVTYDNRKIVKEGLKNLNKGYATTGLKTLCSEAKLREIDSIGLGFSLSPIINASGRMFDEGPTFMTNLISHDVKNDEVDQDFILKCQKAIENNTKRKSIEAEALKNDFERIDSSEMKNQNFIVLVDETVSSGIVGLISGKITEAYNRPSIVLTSTADPELLKGSGRSIEGVDLKKILDKNNSLIEAYGGHAQACGITLRRSVLEEFTKNVNDSSPQFKLCDDVFYDVETTIQDAFTLYEKIKRFEPYGQDNPEIRVCIKGIEPDYAQTRIPIMFMGNERQHLKIVADGLNVLWFNHANDYIEMGAPEKVDVIGSLGINSFNGVETLQIIVSSMRPSK